MFTLPTWHTGQRKALPVLMSLRYWSLSIIHLHRRPHRLYLLTHGFLSSLHGGHSLFWPMASEDLCSLQQEGHSRVHGAEPVVEPFTSWRSSNRAATVVQSQGLGHRLSLLVTHSPAKPSKRFHNLSE